MARTEEAPRKPQRIAARCESLRERSRKAEIAGKRNTSSCRSGSKIGSPTCGTCVARAIGGEPKQRPWNRRSTNCVPSCNNKPSSPPRAELTLPTVPDPAFELDPAPPSIQFGADSLDAGLGPQGNVASGNLQRGGLDARDGCGVGIRLSCSPFHDRAILAVAAGVSQTASAQGAGLRLGVDHRPLQSDRPREMPVILGVRALAIAPARARNSRSAWPRWNRSNWSR